MARTPRELAYWLSWVVVGLSVGSWDLHGFLTDGVSSGTPLFTSTTFLVGGAGLALGGGWKLIDRDVEPSAGRYNQWFTIVCGVGVALGWILSVLSP